MSVLIDRTRCTACGNCIEICPGDLLTFDATGKASMRNAADCWDCMACVKICPQMAITTKLPYQLADYKAILQPEVHKDRIVWTCTDSDGNSEQFTVKTMDF